MNKQTAILHVLAILCLIQAAWTYPVFGTKRYGRSTQYAPATAPATYPIHIAYHQPARAQRFHPIHYYDLYPYESHGYGDDYYYPTATNYPIYYAPARTSKYEVYQAVLPYYYDDRRIAPQMNNYRYYGYDDESDPVDSLQEEIQQEQEREEREESSPIGQETWYEGEAKHEDEDDSMDAVNAAFLQNLILTQMYNNALDDRSRSYDNADVYADDVIKYYPEDDGYTWQDLENAKKLQQEDEDVRELKQLASAPEKDSLFKEQKQSAAERMEIFRKGSSKKKTTVAGPNDGQKWSSSWTSKRNVGNNQIDLKESSENGPVVYGKAKIVLNNRKQQHDKDSTTTVNPASSSTMSSSESARKDARGGQKEVMLMRPATPIRHPFSEPVMEMLAEKNNNKEMKRTPSVYDTIKHMLEMEKNLEKENKQNQRQDIRPPMKKRIVMNEETLVKQLSGLKKTDTA